MHSKILNVWAAKMAPGIRRAFTIEGDLSLNPEPARWKEVSSPDFVLYASQGCGGLPTCITKAHTQLAYILNILDGWTV